jgi:hypothetical protein
LIKKNNPGSRVAGAEAKKEQGTASVIESPPQRNAAPSGKRRRWSREALLGALSHAVRERAGLSPYSPRVRVSLARIAWLDRPEAVP